MNGRMTLPAAALIAVLAAGLPAAPVRPAATADLTGEEILTRLDANAVSDTRYVSLKMTINRSGRRRKELTMQCWVQGRDRAAIEITSGPDQGTRYLKLGADLWIASREAEKPMKISGLLLRQSMLDSSWSYQDMTDNRPLAERFAVKLGGTETRAGRPVWVLSLTAKSPDESYPLQTLWVDQQTFLPVRQELKALSGMLLKTLDFEDLRQVQGRWTPMKMTMRDALKKDSVTTVEVLEIKFGIPIDPKIISLEFVENVH